MKIIWHASKLKYDVASVFVMFVGVLITLLNYLYRIDKFSMGMLIVAILFFAYTVVDLRKSVLFCESVSEELISRGYTDELKSVSTIRHAKSAPFLGFFVGKVHYPIVPINDQYKVAMERFGDKVIFYAYTFESGTTWIAVAERSRMFGHGELRAYYKPIV